MVYIKDGRNKIQKIIIIVLVLFKVRKTYVKFYKNIQKCDIIC